MNGFDLIAAIEHAQRAAIASVALPPVPQDGHCPCGQIPSEMFHFKGGPSWELLICGVNLYADVESLESDDNHPRYRAKQPEKGACDSGAAKILLCLHCAAAYNLSDHAIVE